MIIFLFLFERKIIYNNKKAHFYSELFNKNKINQYK